MLWPDIIFGRFFHRALWCVWNAPCQVSCGPWRNSELLGVSQLCKQSITSDGKWITTHYLCSCASGTEREHSLQTDWNGLSGAREERPLQSHRKASIRIIDKVLLLYCTIVLRETMFYCYWHQTPIWRKYPTGVHHTSPPWQKPNLWCCILKCAVWNWKVSDTDNTWNRPIIESWSNNLQCFSFK